MLAQAVKMRDGNAGQPRVLGSLVEQVFAFQDAPRRRTAQRLVSLIDRGKQLDVGPCVATRETPPPIDRHLHPPAGRVASDQPRNLRPAQPGHLLDLAQYQAPRRLAQLRVLLPDQNPFYSAINLLPVLALKPDLLAAGHEPANRFQTQLLCIVHADVHYPA